MKLHPIQLLSVETEELSIVVHERIKFLNSEYPKDFDYTIFSTEFDQEQSIVKVKVELNVKPPEGESIDRPFTLKVGVAGAFKVDTSIFPADKLDVFIVHNAPLILLPYVREHAFSLTQRAGFEAIILPLVEVPTIKISKEKQD